MLHPGGASASANSGNLDGRREFQLSDRWRLSEEVVTRFSDNRNGLYEIEAATMLNYRLRKNVTIAAGYIQTRSISAATSR